jgi:hypothetical protein
MWHRTKRLINSYLDELINRVSSPDKEARDITRAELARLNELEVQTIAAPKMLEKELAEVELKMVGVLERERIFRERGDMAGATSAAGELARLASHRDFLNHEIAEARASATRASALREQRRRQGKELANDTYLTDMRENLARVQSPFDATDPSATIDEMRARIASSTGPSAASRAAEVDRELEALESRSRVDEMLLRYKKIVTDDESSPTSAIVSPPVRPDPPESASTDPAQSPEGEPEQKKTLGRNHGPVRPLD